VLHTYTVLSPLSSSAARKVNSKMMILRHGGVLVKIGETNSNCFETIQMLQSTLRSNDVIWEAGLVEVHDRDTLVVTAYRDILVTA